MNHQSEANRYIDPSKVLADLSELRTSNFKVNFKYPVGPRDGTELAQARDAARGAAYFLSQPNVAICSDTGFEAQRLPVQPFPTRYKFHYAQLDTLKTFQDTIQNAKQPK